MRPRLGRWPLRPSCAPGGRDRARHADQAAGALARDWTPIVEEIKVASGYEQALGRGARRRPRRRQRRGRALPLAADGRTGSDPALPDGATPLSQFVNAPKALRRRLAQIGVVEAGRGRELQAMLAPGQRLVSKEGDLWRWDGYQRPGRHGERRRGAAGRAAPVGGAQNQRSPRREAHAAEAEAASCRRRSPGPRRAQLKTKALRQEAKAAHAELDRTRDAIAAAEHEAQLGSKELGALAEALSRTRAAFDEAEAHGAQVAAALLELAALGTAWKRHSKRRKARRRQSRQAAARAEAALEGFEREVQLRQERIEAIGAEEELWRKRIANAREQILTLRAREEETSADLAALANLPAEIEQRRGQAVRRHRRGRARARQGRRRSCAGRDGAQGAARRRCARCRSGWPKRAKPAPGARRGSKSARERRSEVAHAIREQLDCAPEACLDARRAEAGRRHSRRWPRSRRGCSSSRAIASGSAASISGPRKKRPTLAAQLEEMEREKADVEEAIARLRQGISNLNREGRKRLLEAFDAVNGHFRTAVQDAVRRRHGRAQAGRFRRSARSRGSRSSPARRASGRKSLTLLSGGEKALTALALIFAVFLTNPSPICVLDEVDAPLDDANVERFCLLMEEMAKETDTRFLIITHHPLTMSRMSRLFGVTMAERGVSQLVSVDLETAERLRDAS